MKSMKNFFITFLFIVQSLIPPSVLVLLSASGPAFANSQSTSKPKVIKPISESVKAKICDGLNSHIPNLMNKLNKAEAEVPRVQCDAVKKAFKDSRENSAALSFDGNPGHQLKDWNCKKNYKDLRDIYNKITARHALLSEISRYQHILESGYTPREVKQQALN